LIAIKGKLADHRIMRDEIDQLATFLYLANANWKKLQMSDRDRLLVLSAIQATDLGFPSIAAFCRQLVLKNNPGHMLRRWDTVEEALKSEDLHVFLKQLRRRFPVERAETMLAEIGIQLANERATYYTPFEYLTSIMGVEPGWLEEHYSPETRAKGESPETRAKGESPETRAKGESPENPPKGRGTKGPPSGKDSEGPATDGGPVDPPTA
jgi:hypothetical protein